MALQPMPPERLRQLQSFLLRKGFAQGNASSFVDGDYGPKTEAAFDAWITTVSATAVAPASAPASPLAAGAALVIPGLPKQYGWLTALGELLPLTIEEALKEYGTKEVAGAANSPTIMAWAAEVGLKAVYTADKIPWCGLFAAVIAKRARKPVVKDPLWALNWGKFGVEVQQPGLGDILTFLRDGGGHVGFYVGEDRGTAAQKYEDAAYHVIGGNQSDAVTITRILKKRLQKARRPIYQVQPASVKPYILAAAGALSSNEA